MAPRQIVSLFFSLFASFCWIRPNMAAECTKELDEARQISAAVQTSLRAPAQVKAGNSFSIAWLTKQSMAMTAPIYLVVAAEPNVRFAGSGFLALAPGGAAPRDIAYANDHARAFIPLHWKLNAGGGGEIKIIPQSAGSSEAATAIIYAGDCGEKLLSEARYSISVAAGSADIVVQDHFSADTPDRAIKSLDGKHILRIFKNRYEVLIATTGDMVLSGEGRDPNFSPTGRFLAVQHTADAGYDLFDLVGQPRLIRMSEHSTDSNALIWSNKDSFIVISDQKWGGIAAFNTLTNSAEIVSGGDDCHACTGDESNNVVLDLDRGFAAIFPKSGSGDAMIADLYRRSPAQKVELSEAVPFVRSNYDASFSLLPATWDLAGEGLLSHYSGWEPSNAEITQIKNKSQRTAFLEARAKFAAQAARIVHHVTISAVEAAPAIGGGNQIAGTFRSRRIVRSGRRTIVSDLQYASVEDRLAQIGIKLAPPRPANLLYQKDHSIRQSPTNLKKLNALASPMRASLNASGRKTIFSDGPCLMVENTDLFTEADRIYGWTDNESKVWIINTQCMQGTAANLYSDMYMVTWNGRLFEFYDLRTPFGSSGGGWAEELQHVGVYRLTDTLVAFASPMADSMTIKDLSKPNAKRRDFALYSPALLSTLRLTEDLSSLVQINSDGSLFVTRLTDGQLLLSGAYVDDEVVVSNADGYYDATFEGAQLVNVRFSGIAGIHRFDQFEPLLYKPGLAAMVTSGAKLDPPARLSAPPSAILYMDKDEKLGKRTGSVEFSSQNPIKEVRLYVDGRVTAALEARDRAGGTSFSVDDPGPGHWISAVTVDHNGLASVPSAVRVPGKFISSGKLNSVAVGIDRYSDSRITQLKQAAYDAKNITSALSSLEKRTFAQVNTSLLLNTDATRDRILQQIRMAAERTSENDRMVVYFAGHGIDGKEFGDPDSNLYLVTSNTSFDRVRETALPWKLVAEALAVARGTAIVILDACHSGFAGKRDPLSNDRAAKALLTRSGAPILVLAASKGRQLSEETNGGGGRFTNALVAAIGQSAQAREPTSLTEFYRNVKSKVMKDTDSRQTPWMVRDGLVGEMSLF